MIIFIYGVDSFTSKIRLDFLKTEFIKKYQDINVVTIFPDNIGEGFNFSQHLNGAPFLAEKRMVIIRNFLSELNKESLDWLSKNIKGLPQHTVLVIYESGEDFDKRMSLYKNLQKNAKIEFFPKADISSIKSLIQKITTENNISIDDDALNLLTMLWGAKKKESDADSKNLNSLKNDLEKIVLLLKAENRDIINSDDVSNNVTVSAEAKVFDLIDYIGKKKSKKAMFEMESLLESGESEFYILSMIVYQFRILLKIKALTYENASTEEIKSRLKMHPYVLTKAMDQVKNYSLDELKNIYHQLMMLEKSMKMTDTNPIIGLSKFIVEISR